MGKKKLIILISSIAAAVVAAVVTVVLIVVLGNKKPQGYDRIRIASLDGTVTVNDGEDSVSGYVGMNLYNSYTIEVSAGGVVVIKCDEDKYVYLSENSFVRIIEEKKKTNFYVERGEVLAEIQNKLSEDEEFYLSTTNSVMAVRGTVFGVVVIPGEEEITATFSVYKGVTELLVLDKSSGNLVSGKLTDLSNTKLEIVIPKKEAISFEEMEEVFESWMEEYKDVYDDVNDANSSMDEVQITVTKPDATDYSKVADTIESSVSYSLIPYESNGYHGPYDGKQHSIAITTDVENAVISYKDSEDGEYSKENTFSYKLPGEYRVYYKIEAEGYAAKEDYEVIYITELTQVYSASGYSGPYDKESHSITVETNAVNPKITYKTSEVGEYTETLPTFTTEGEYKVYYKIEAEGYKTVTDFATVRITLSNLKYTSSGYVGPYDGKAHTISVQTDVENAKITYKTSEDGEYTESVPTFTNEGEYKIYFRIEAVGYRTITDTAIVRITLSNLKFTSSGYVGAYDGEAHTISVSTEEASAVIRYTTDPKKEYSLEAPTFTEPGKYIVYFTIEALGYETISSFESITIEAKNVEVSVSAYTGSYDGEAHLPYISVMSGNEEVEYSIVYRLNEKDEFTEAVDTVLPNVYTVEYQISSPGAKVITGTEMVTITKADLVVTPKSDEKVISLPEGMHFDFYLANHSLQDNYTITSPVEEDNSLFSDATIEPIEDLVQKGIHEYSVEVRMPEIVSELYNPVTIVYTVEGYEVTLLNSGPFQWNQEKNMPMLTAISDITYDGASGFSVESVFMNATFVMLNHGDDPLNGDTVEVNSIEIEDTYWKDDMEYFSVTKDSIQTLSLALNTEQYDRIELELTFMYVDTRNMYQITTRAESGKYSVQELGTNLYFVPVPNSLLTNEITTDGDISYVNIKAGYLAEFLTVEVYDVDRETKEIGNLSSTEYRIQWTNPLTNEVIDTYKADTTEYPILSNEFTKAMVYIPVNGDDCYCAVEFYLYFGPTGSVPEGYPSVTIEKEYTYTGSAIELRLETSDGTEILFKDGEAYTALKPSFLDAGEYEVSYKVSQNGIELEYTTIIEVKEGTLELGATNLPSLITGDEASISIFTEKVVRDAGIFDATTSEEVTGYTLAITDVEGSNYGGDQIIVHIKISKKNYKDYVTTITYYGGRSDYMNDMNEYSEIIFGQSKEIFADGEEHALYSESVTAYTIAGTDHWVEETSLPSYRDPGVYTIYAYNYARTGTGSTYLMVGTFALTILEDDRQLEYDIHSYLDLYKEVPEGEIVYSLELQTNDEVEATMNVSEGVFFPAFYVYDIYEETGVNKSLYVEDADTFGWLTVTPEAINEITITFEGDSTAKPVTKTFKVYITFKKEYVYSFSVKGCSGDISNYANEDYTQSQITKKFSDFGSFSFEILDYYTSDGDDQITDDNELYCIVKVIPANTSDYPITYITITYMPALD